MRGSSAVPSSRSPSLEMRRSRSSGSLSDAQSAASISRTVSVRAGHCHAFAPPKKACLPSRTSCSMLPVVLNGNEETALRLGAALLVGTIFGLNRELHGKPAGLRTHALVSLGAAVATVVILRSTDGSLAADQ